MEVALSPPPDTASSAGVAVALDEATDAELTERFRELELRRRGDEAEMAAIVDHIDRRATYRDDGHRSVAGWVRLHLNCANGRITQLRRTGRLLREEPAIADQLASGRIGIDQAAELARARANPRCGTKLSESLDLLLDSARRLKFEEFRQVVRRWEIMVDLDGAHRDRGGAMQSRRAMIAAGTDGVDLVATGGTALHAAEMQAILEAFTEAEFRADQSEARHRLGDDTASSRFARTDTQRRFDALVKLFHVANNSTAEATPPAATVDVVVDQYTFEAQLAAHGLAAEPTDLVAPGPAGARCHTDRGIPVLPDDAVLAALGGWVRRVVIDSAGVIVDMGHRSRCFTGSAAEAARLFATICELPGCTIPAHWCQVDHMTEWEDDGPTNQANAAIVCGHGNRHKHRRKLTARRDRQGRVQVQRPDGTWILPVGVDPPTDADFTTPEGLHQQLAATGWTVWHRAA